MPISQIMYLKKKSPINLAEDFFTYPYTRQIRIPLPLQVRTNLLAAIRQRESNYFVIRRVAMFQPTRPLVILQQKICIARFRPVAWDHRTQIVLRQLHRDAIPRNITFNVHGAVQSEPCRGSVAVVEDHP